MLTDDRGFCTRLSEMDLPSQVASKHESSVVLSVEYLMCNHIWVALRTLIDGRCRNAEAR